MSDTGYDTYTVVSYDRVTDMSDTTVYFLFKGGGWPIFFTGVITPHLYQNMTEWRRH